MMELNTDYIKSWKESAEKDIPYLAALFPLENTWNIGFAEGIQRFVTELLYTLENKLSEKSLNIVIETINNLQS